MRKQERKEYDIKKILKEQKKSKKMVHNKICFLDLELF